MTTDRVRWLKRSLVLAAVVVLGFVLRLTILAPDAIHVLVETVGRGSVEETITNSRAGTVKAKRRAELSPELGGRVVLLPYREGAQVQYGAIVLQLDDEMEQAGLLLAMRELEAARAQQDAACSTAKQAEREELRVRRLAEDEIASADLLDKARTEAESSAAACRAAAANAERSGAAVQLSEARLRKMVLRAPFDGVVAEVSTELGEWVTPSPPGLPIPPVIDLLDPDSIYVSAPMDEVDSARISTGQRVWVTVDSHPNREFEGRVVRVAPYVLDVEEQNRTVEIEVELDDEGLSSGLLPGTSADVEVVLEKHEHVLRVPTPALMEGGRVLILEEDRLVARVVRPGLRNWDYTEVLDGLEEGERIVTSLDRVGVEVGARVTVDALNGAP